MTNRKLTFISFEPVQGHFRGLLSLDGILSKSWDAEKITSQAATVYENHIAKMRQVFAEIYGLRKARRLTPARKVWEMGDYIFALRNSLDSMSLEIDSIYHHLERDLGAKRKWLEKAIILRRYVHRADMIPEDLNWGRLEKGTRKAAEMISKGLALPKRGRK
ncbi:MAG: hypothetical protein FJ320_05885 [SAR202 cluster bacterium]|nr:hypothetical protein [SAR202 cluster bacterium]